MGKILVLTNVIDPHADAVINNIKNKDAVFRVNTDEILNSFGYEFVLNADGNFCYFKNPIGGVLNTEEISCVYYRRPEKPTYKDPNSITKVSVDEAWHGLYHVLFGAYNRTWLGHPHRDKYASSRVVQLSTANRLGWRVPPTVISRDPIQIRDFALRHKDLAIKPLGEKGASMDGQWVPYFTSRISGDEIMEKTDSEISSTYNYIQAYIPKKNEWRITVVGDQVFPCVIHSQESESGKVDWRTVSFDTLLHEQGIIPKKFSKELVQYLKSLQLPFGAFDFILTPENEFVFLECNPNGQWLWIENLTGFPISKAIANWLEKVNYEFLP